MTSIELTDEQQRQIDAGRDRSVDVVHPPTQRAYVLIAREQFEKVRSLLENEPDLSDRPAEEAATMTPTMRRSQETFWRELPELLKTRGLRGQKACYHGEDRIGIARTKAELVKRCLRLGLTPGEFYVGWIDNRSVPPWEPEALEESLFEFEDNSLPPSSPVR